MSTASAAATNTPSLPEIVCQLFLGGVPLCPASSCKEIAETTLWSDFRSGLHWLTTTIGISQGYCVEHIPPVQSRGWMKVAYVTSSTGCPAGLEQVTRGGRKLCQKTVERGCSSVIFHTNRIKYSKVCGRVFGYQSESTDGFV